MASRGQYLLRIGGRLEGNLKEKDVLSVLGQVFRTPRGGEGVPGERDTGGWPEGFVLMNYSPCQWDLKVDYPHPDQTMISFRAEIHHTFPNSLYQNRAEMLRHVEWFYHYREYRWWKELTKHLEKDVNPALRKKFKQDCMPERLWFRDWQWYCGNGGC
ncbi:MAG TPA: hypothetical protein VIG70_12565 [Burkholderiales bacterium]|jgi:hypothetical protein